MELMISAYFTNYSLWLSQQVQLRENNCLKYSRFAPTCCKIILYIMVSTTSASPSKNTKNRVENSISNWWQRLQLFIFVIPADQRIRLASVPHRPSWRESDSRQFCTYTAPTIIVMTTTIHMLVSYLSHYVDYVPLFLGTHYRYASCILAAIHHQRCF